MNNSHISVFIYPVFLGLIYLNNSCRRANATERILEDDIISCYTLIQNYSGWQKEKVSDTIIKSAEYPYNCPKLPYKIYEGRAYNWKQGNAPAANFTYLCIKDLNQSNRYNLLLLTPQFNKTLNSQYIGSTICNKLNFLLTVPQWTQFAD